VTWATSRPGHFLFILGESWCLGGEINLARLALIARRECLGAIAGCT